MRTPRCSLPDLPATAPARRRRQAPAPTKWRKRNLSWRWAGGAPPGLAFLGVWVSAKMSTHRPGLKRQELILSVLETRNPRSGGHRSLGGCEGESGPAPVQVVAAALGPWL